MIADALATGALAPDPRGAVGDTVTRQQLLESYPALIGHERRLPGRRTAQERAPVEPMSGGGPAKWAFSMHHDPAFVGENKYITYQSAYGTVTTQYALAYTRESW